MATTTRISDGSRRSLARQLAERTGNEPEQHAWTVDSRSHEHSHVSRYPEQPRLSNLSLVRDGQLEPVSERVTTGEVKMRPIQRLGLLCDEGSLQVLRSAVMSERMGARAFAGDGVVGAAGRIGGRPVFCYAQDASFARGSLGQAHAETIVRVLGLARQANVPVIGFIESGGSRR